MKIKYLDCDGKSKLFSFHRHDYKEMTIDDTFYMIDGGFDYIKTSISGTIKEGEVSDLIEDIRNQFEWGSNYTETGELRDTTIYSYLKDMEISHILNILSWDMNGFFKRLSSNENVVINIGFCVTREIFIQELKYRLNNDKY